MSINSDHTGSEVHTAADDNVDIERGDVISEECPKNLLIHNKAEQEVKDQPWLIQKT